MKINDLKPAPGAKKSRRRLGRGLGSGRGKTAGRGQKGQRSRSGFSQMPGWEGERSRLIMRLPKRGFNNNQFKTFYQIVNLADLNRFADGDTVNAESLHAKGLIRRLSKPIKLLGNGVLEVSNLTVQVDAYSRSAVQALTHKGGQVLGDSAADASGTEANSSEARHEEQG